MSTCHIFTYGSLMFSEVWERVVKGRYRFAEAVLNNHGRFALRDETYPGMVPKPGQTVAGVVYFDVKPEDVAALDTFEGAPYRRETVRVQTAHGEMVATETYLFLHTERLSDAPWQPEAFQLQRFIATYCRDRQV